ncbi:hypothetical protein COLO4_01916 [Corchorus olitorius]|uniref:Uncharacterized protein n=1 Tax=Corchorus olitorius TaxID=93759 RepID=A0A1R3L1T0_9ROSI|nr:hypothetical protein COLO4_01916 [Corchorus olitorius]
MWAAAPLLPRPMRATTAAAVATNSTRRYCINATSRTSAPKSPAIATIADAPPGDDPHAPVGPGSELKRTSRKPDSPLAASVSSSTASTTGQSSSSGERIAGDRLWPIMQPSTACASTNSRLSMRTVAPLRPIMPVLPFEIEIRRQPGENHQANRTGITKAPLQLRHKLKVHTVAGGHQRRRQEHHGHHREDFDDAQRFDVAQDLARLLQLIARQPRFTHQEVQRTLGIHQAQTHFPADIFQLRQARQRVVVLFALLPFHDHAAEFFQRAIDVLDLIRQLLDFGFEQIEQQLVGVAVGQLLIARAHAVQAERRQLTLAQCVQTIFADGKRHGGVAGVIFSIF